ncbi:MAG: efflux RND transporter periplasmic adaptor subunit [Gemmatimonadota bacterium]
MNNEHSMDNRDGGYPMTIEVKRAAALSAGLLAALLVGCGGQAQAGANDGANETPGFQRIINVQVAALAASAFDEEIRLTGTVEANRDVQISAEEGGVIRQLLVEKGRRVSAAQPIAKIDDAVLAAQVEQARAQARLAQETWERRQRLYEQDKVGSELAYLESKYMAEQSAASLRALEERLARTMIRAPIAGILDDRMVEIGSMVSPGIPVARILQLDPVKVRAGVPERYALNVKRGDSVAVSFDALGGRSFSGTISYVGAAVDPGNRTFPVEFTVPNRDEAIKPEMVASVAIRSARVEDAIVVPQQALIRVEDGYVVFVAVDEGGETLARRREVQIGASQQNRVVVESGLQAGDRLIVVGQQQVAEGDRIRIVNGPQT